MATSTGLGRSPGEGVATHSSFWSGEFHGLYSPWGCKESDMTELTFLMMATSKNLEDTEKHKEKTKITFHPISRDNQHWHSIIYFS